MIKVRWIIAAALLLSAAATYGLFQVLDTQAKKSEADKAGYRNVVLASMHLAAGSKIGESDIRQVAWPSELLPEGSFSELKEVVGRVMKSEAYPGDAIMESKLAPSGSEGGFSSIIPKGMRALTVEVNTYVGVGGFILPNTSVDVLVTVPSSKQKEEASTRIILQDIKVLAVDQTFERKGDDQVTVQTVTLLVTPEQAEKLVLGSTEGKLQLTLRNDSDDAKDVTSGVKLKDLVASQPPKAPEKTVTRQAPKNRKVVEVIRSGEREAVTFENGRRK
jgi:pilus assembly protein CpaB